MFKKIFKFVKGYVIIEISGKNKERFINMCLHNGIDAYDIAPCDAGLRLKTDYSGFVRMRRLVRKSRIRVKIVSKRGMRRSLYLYRRRFGFVISGILVCIFFLLLPQYILCVEIDGAYNSDKEEIYRVLKEHGVYVGAKKSGMDDLSEIKNAVVFGVDGINWAWLYNEGARMRLEIQEYAAAPKVKDKTEPVDIIAACDGWIRRVDVFRGERQVSKGTAVSAGQVLVSGKVGVYREGMEEKYIYVHSDADIVADTIRTEKARFSATETLRVKTGNSKRVICVDWFGKKLNLFRDISCGYTDYDVTEQRHNFDLPVVGYSGIALISYSIDEVNEVKHKLSRDEILDRAKENLEEKICRNLGSGAVKLSEELNCSESGDGFDVELKMYLQEHIGVEVPRKGE